MTLPVVVADGDSNNTTDTKLQQQEEEHWTDAQVRFQQQQHDNNEITPAQHEEEETFVDDPFRTDPRTQFTLNFCTPNKINNNPALRLTITLDGYTYESDETWESTGLTLWRASKSLAQHLVVSDRTILPKPKVLELGAGLGLVGIVAYQCCCLAAQPQKQQPLSSIVLTDGDTQALRQLRANVARNQRSLNNSSNSNNNCVAISCQQLVWGKETATKWRDVHGSFHVILAADVVYSPVIVEPLWETVHVLLQRPTTNDDDNGGVFLLAFCTQRDVDVTLEETLAAAVRYGFRYTCTDTATTNQNDDVAIYEFRWA